MFVLIFPLYGNTSIPQAPRFSSASPIHRKAKTSGRCKHTVTNWKHFLAKHIRVRKYRGFISFAPSLSIRMPKISAQKMVFSKLRSTKWSVLACKDMMREGNHLISTLSSLYYAFVLTEYLHFAWLCVWGTVLVIFMWQHKIWYAISKEKTEAPRIARGPGGLFTFAV